MIPKILAEQNFGENYILNKYMFNLYFIENTEKQILNKQLITFLENIFFKTFIFYLLNAFNLSCLNILNKKSFSSLSFSVFILSFINTFSFKIF